MTERLPCESPGCTARILPATALKTGGICMPCQQKKLSLEKEAYILKNRKDINRYAGLVEPIEILKVMHAPRQYNPLENDLPYPKSAQELYYQLSESERDQLETYAITLINNEDIDQADDILLSLVCYSNSRIDRGLTALLHHGKYDPDILFKDADAAIRDKLIHQLADDSDNRNHLLLALAWIGDEEVVQLFEKWRLNPPSWASELHVPPAIYSHEAGWELDFAGQKRLLYHSESYHFKVSEIEEDQSVQSAIMALKTDDQTCPWCNSKLTVMFDINLQDPLVQFIKLSGQRLRIAACIHCNCYGTVFMRVELDGSFSWSEYNTEPDFLPEPDLNEEWSWNAIRLSEDLKSAYDGAYWMLDNPTSKIGGHPAWIQDFDYPSCPCCSKTMMFIGQIDMEQVADSEGIYYAFLCEECLMAAVNYQQT
ncbi:DUF1963 domain-containing protein [Neobacillus mesonae]|nr:DUF1963 domain-containing protein [Neobacillus mesonae]